jgi:hypothetical protein
MRRAVRRAKPLLKTWRFTVTAMVVQTVPTFRLT